MTADIFCAFCPAGHFVSQQALTDHMERDCLGYAAERTAARPGDPLAVLRAALVWAVDEVAPRLIQAEFHPLLEPARLRPVKAPPGFAAALVGSDRDVAIRARLTTGGRELHIQIDIPPRWFQRTRLHLPPEFAALVDDRAPVLRDSRAMAEQLAEAAERGLHASEIAQ